MRRDRTDGLIPARSIAATLLACLVAASLAATPVVDFDVWCHLRTGGDAIAERRFPSPDRYSFTASGRPYDAHEWASQLLLHAVHAAFGNAGLVGAKVAALAGLAAVVAAVGGGTAQAAAVAALSAWLALPRLQERPHLVTLVLVAAAMWLWDREGPPIGIALVFGVIWANAHAGAAILPPLLLLRLLGEKLAGGGWPSPGSRLVRSSAAAGLATFLNPSGPLLLVKPLSLSEESRFAGVIQEWVPLFAPALAGHPARRVYVLTVVLLMAAAVLAGRRVPWRWLPWIAVAVLLPLRASRYLEVLVPAAGCFASVSLGMLVLRGRMAPRILAGLLGLALAASLVPSVRGAAGLPAMGAGIGHEIPAATARLLEREGITGRGYNELQLGCYLLFARPREKVFVDGRLTVYGPDLVARIQRAGGDSRELGRLLHEHRIDYAVLRQPPEGAGAEVDCQRELRTSLGFVPVHLDDAAIVYVRSSGALSGVAERLALRAVDPLDPVGSALARPEARQELERLEGQAPESVRVLTALGIARTRGGALEVALPPLKKATSLSPDSSIAWWALGMLHLQRRDATAALDAADRTVALAPGSPAGHRLRALALRALGRVAEAADAEASARAATGR